MQVAVAGVKHVGDEHVVARGDRRHLAHDERELGARHHRVLQEIRRGEPADRARRLLAALPEEGALGLVARHSYLDGAMLATQGGGALGLDLGLGARTIQLDEEHRGSPLGESGARRRR